MRRIQFHLTQSQEAKKGCDEMEGRIEDAANWDGAKRKAAEKVEHWQKGRANRRCYELGGGEMEG